MRVPAPRPAERVPESSEGSSSAAGSAAEPKRRLLAVSHPAIVRVNQEVYRELARRGWDVKIVVPSRWSHDYAADPLTPHALEGLEGALLPTRVAFPGRPQRYFHLGRPTRLGERLGSSVAFVEGEPFSLVAMQWSRAFMRLGIPFGVQCYENIDRALPLPVRLMRTRVLQRVAFVAARSESAAELARRWGARGEIGLAPPAVPSWPDPPAQSPARPFTVGYAGRLVESKGLLDLVAAVRLLDPPVELLLIGDGELRAQLDRQPIPGSSIRVLSGLDHQQMPSGYAQVDVIVLPSRTTPTWKEQFGRVIVEALYCGVPVVGSNSGEIPWLIGTTGGGLVFPEGDREALAERLARLRDQPELRRSLADAGRASVLGMFTVAAATDAFERLLASAALARRHGSR